MEERDLILLRISFKLAKESRESGAHPFGAILVDQFGHILLRAKNTCAVTNDCTGHAETNIIREACLRYSHDFLANCTLYASTEPCPMCAGAIFWGNVRRLVYGLSQEGLYSMIDPSSEDVLILHCQEIFARGKKNIEVIGSLLEDEARQVHEGFWINPQQ